MNSSRHSSGTYSYLCNGEETGIEETWGLTENDGLRTIVSERRAPSVGICIRVESQQRSGQFQQCNIDWQQKTDGQQLTVNANYCFDDKGATISRNGPGASTAEASLPFIFSPLMRIYNGEVIQQLLGNGCRGRVMVPWIKDHRQEERLLVPDFSERQVSETGKDFLSVDGQEHRCNTFHYSGGEYQAGTPFWIDEDGVMLMYCWEQDKNTQWQVKLRDYQPLS